MTVESPPQLEFITNGEITLIGRTAHELLLYDILINNHNNPEAKFAMSPEMVETYTTRRAEHLETLGIDESQADKRIAEIREELKQQFAVHQVEPTPRFITPTVNLSVGQPYTIPYV